MDEGFQQWKWRIDRALQRPVSDLHVKFVFEMLLVMDQVCFCYNCDVIGMKWSRFSLLVEISFDCSQRLWCFVISFTGCDFRSGFQKKRWTRQVLSYSVMISNFYAATLQKLTWFWCKTGQHFSQQLVTKYFRLKRFTVCQWTSYPNSRTAFCPSSKSWMWGVSISSCEFSLLKRQDGLEIRKFGTIADE